MKKLIIYFFGLCLLCAPMRTEALVSVDAQGYRVAVQHLLTLRALTGDFNVRRVISQFEAMRILIRATGQKVVTEEQVASTVQELQLSNNYKASKRMRTSDFIHALFKISDIEVSGDDFLNPEMDEAPETAYAKLLNIVDTRGGKISERLTYGKVAQIIHRFWEIKDVLLQDSMYGKLDMHEHYIAGADIQKMFKMMGVFGIEKVYLMPTGRSPDNRGYLENTYELLKLQKKYPDKIWAWCTIDEANPRAPEILERCLENGGKGLKLLGGHPNLYDEPLDSENMFKVYKIADEYDVPVLIHGSVINIPTMWDELNHAYSSFPDVTFVQAHYCSVIMKNMDLPLCQELLDKYPNLNIDMSLGGGIGRHLKFYKEDPDQIRNFIDKNQDRIMFGTDIILTSRTESDWLYSRMKCDFDLHQNDTLYCEHSSDPEVEWTGLALPRNILQKIYFDNPKRILGE